MAVEVARQQGGPKAPGAWSRLVDFLLGVRVEMRKVTWPDMPQVRQATIAIIIFVLIIGLIITLMDAIFSTVLVRMIPALFAGS